MPIFKDGKTRMRCLSFVVIGLLFSLGTPAAQLTGDEKDVLKIWPRGLPAGAVKIDAEKAEELRKKTTAERIAFVDDPTLTLFRAPQDKANGCAVVVCPGGGYNILAWNKEGVEVAQWLNTLGVTAAVLKYRVPRRDPQTPHTEPLQDIQRAVRVVRHHAKPWGVDHNRVGVLGFSAGGHLAVMAGTKWDQKTYSDVDEADSLSCRPDFLIPIYAAYLGAEQEPTRLSTQLNLTKQTPPMFMAVTWDDSLRGLHAGLLLAELKKHGVKAEAHIFLNGGHGYGLRPSSHAISTWPKLCGDWMKASGFLKTP